MFWHLAIAYACVQDYRDVEYVLLESKARLALDPTQAIELLDSSQETARVRLDYLIFQTCRFQNSSPLQAETRAQPDNPRIPDKRRVPIWIIVVAVIGGIFLLFLITVLFWKVRFAC